MNQEITSTSQVEIGEIVALRDHPVYGVVRGSKAGQKYRVTGRRHAHILDVEPLDPDSPMFPCGLNVTWVCKIEPTRPRYWIKVYGPLIGGNHVFADGYDHYLVEQPTDVFLENDCVIIFAAPSKHGDRDVPAYSVTYLPGQATKVVMGIVTPKED